MKRIFTTFAAMLLVIASCEKAPSDPSASTQAVTGEVKQVNAVSAVISGQAVISGDASSEAVFGILYSTTNEVTYGSATEVKATNRDSEGKFEVSVAGLNPTTEYWFRTYINLNSEVTYGDVKSFKTTSYKDLSSDGTANCYIVSAPGSYKFKATVKGGTSKSVGTPVKVEVLWESFGNATVPAVGSVITAVTLNSDYVEFSTPAEFKDGNAVIAVKNSSEYILWSWHIWVCGGYDPSTCLQAYNNKAGTLMDRNLGATSASSDGALGLLYQWGRKDPFLGSSSIASGNSASSTIKWPEPINNSSTGGTVDYATTHPTTFINQRPENGDWYYSGGFNARWTNSDSEKSEYDPCPVGWRVPDGGKSGVWCNAFGTTSEWTTGSNWDVSNKGMDFAKTDKKLFSGSSCWYGAAGCRNAAGGILINVGSKGYYWSSVSTDTSTSYILNFYSDGTVNPMNTYYRANACPVRCAADE